MWRIAVLLFTTVLIQFASADVRNGVDSPIVQRLKRSPQYDNCGGFYRPHPPPPPPPPPFWPPPPRGPSFWPPPPPPPYWPPPQPPPPPPPPPPPQPARYEVISVADSEAKSDANAAGNEGLCTTCGDNGQSNAVSNAQSGSGQAVAVAIARANAH